MTLSVAEGERDTVPGQKQAHTGLRTYLAGFSERLRLNAVNAKTGHRHGISVNDATTQHYFYRRTTDMDNPDFVEDQLSVIERRFSSLLRGCGPVTGP